MLMALMFVVFPKGRIIFYEEGEGGGSEGFMGGDTFFPNLKRGATFFSRV